MRSWKTGPAGKHHSGLERVLRNTRGIALWHEVEHMEDRA